MFKKNKLYKICTFLFVLAVLLSLTSQPVRLAQAAPQPAPQRNFNSHACSDLIIGVPGEGNEEPPVTYEKYGALHLMWSNSDHSGLYNGGAQFWYQGAPTDGDPIGDTAEYGDQFAEALGVGDFNGDGFYDLAVGVPHEGLWVGSTWTDDAGGVNVLYASPTGFSAGVNQWWTQDSTDVSGVPEESDLFGSALAAGDFDGDGYADLAIGAPAENIGSFDNAGYVNILFGRSAGLYGQNIWGAQWGISQDTAGLPDTAEAGDRFGDTLATGDFNGDGFDDLVIGSPEEDYAGADMAGMIHVMYGVAILSFDEQETQMFTQEDWSFTSESGDYFGSALATGDFDRDGYDDLAIGIWGESNGATVNTGALAIIYGSSGGLTTANTEYWYQGQLFDTTEFDDWFGYALAVGDFNGDGYADLAASAPEEDVNAVYDTGSIGIIFGSSAGLKITGTQFITQVSISMSNQEYSRMGRSMAVGDFNCDRHDDLAIGVPYYDYTGVTDSGQVIIMHGGSSGLFYRTNFYQSLLTGVGSNENNDVFGFALASAPINWRSVFAPFIRK